MEVTHEGYSILFCFLQKSTNNEKTSQYITTYTIQ